MNQNSNEEQFRSRITDWPKEERPREKLIRFGAEHISNAELIAILLGQGSQKRNVVELARELLNTFGDLEGLAAATQKEMEQIDGIGPAKALTLLAAFQLYRNLQIETAGKVPQVMTQPKMVADIYIPYLGDKKKESFFVILLDAAMHKIRDVEVSRGLLTASLVHPREVFNPAIKYSAKGVILLHNHPSGQLFPSDEDIKITKKLVESGRLLDIPVYDHLIIARKGYYSFKENNLI